MTKYAEYLERGGGIDADPDPAQNTLIELASFTRGRRGRIGIERPRFRRCALAVLTVKWEAGGLHGVRHRS